MDEDILLRRLQARHRGALHSAIRTYTGYVTAVAARTLGPGFPREDLEEVVSDVFLALWAHAGEIRAGAALRSWLSAAAHNKAVDCLRRTRFTLPLSETVPACSGLPEEIVERQERHAALWRAVEDLGEPDRSLFLRYYYEDQSLSEAAQALGLTLPAAKARLFRGRRRLRDTLCKGGIDHV